MKWIRNEKQRFCKILGGETRCITRDVQMGNVTSYMPFKNNYELPRERTFPLTLRLFAALYFCFPVFFFLIHELGGSIHTKCEGVGRGACLFPLTPVRLAHTSLDFLNVSSSFPRLWTSFLLNPYNLRMNDEARLGNTGMKPPQRYFRMVLFVLEHFT